MFPDQIDKYLEQEIAAGSTMGPFKIPPFWDKIGISPLSSHPKKDSTNRRVILDLSFPHGNSVNDGISKDWYCREPVNLTYPSIDTLTKCIYDIINSGLSPRVWKKDLSRAFRSIPLCPRDFLLI